MESAGRQQRGSLDASVLPRAQEDPELAERYERYIRKAKQEAKNGNLLKSIEYFQKADGIHPSEKLKGRIAKLDEALQELNLQTEQDDEFIDVLNSGLMLYKELYNKLFEHQREGVAFLYSLHRDGRKGGILADDMGLGKTIQVIAFLSGMFDAELANFILLIMPTTLISNWVKEFEKWTPGMRVNEFHGTSKKERSKNLEKIQRKGGVLITTYQMLINNWQQLSTYNGREFTWDYIILDEAHKIKTSATKTAKSCSAIPAKNRILLTGTPVQNNLRELWALFDFACQGTLLGTLKTFKMEYENPITRAREKDSTPGEKALGLKISENLMKIIQPHFLRRTKNEVQDKKEADQQTTNQESNIDVPTMPSLTRKNDFIIWVYLSPIQEDVYRQFISLDQIKELLMTTRSPLAELNILKKLCDHPRLLSARACVQLGLEGDGTEENALEAITRYDHLSDEGLIEESGKLMFLIDLLHKLKNEGHRTLVFSQSRKMLDMIDRILNNRSFKVMRIDGTVPLFDRQKRISTFQNNSSYSVLLLTTQVGGVGLTLTAADRVVIFDPSWNPATDAQAVDRAYRIGQQENVVIYRLITCGTVEEKIYRRQIFKDSLIRQTTGDKKNPFRYFSKQELKELFSLADTRTSSTQIQLQNMHSSQRKTDTNLDEHIAYLHTLEIFGISDHDLIYTHEVSSQDEEAEYEGQYIQERVQKAHELVQMESQMNEQLMEQIRKGSEGAWLRPNVFPEKVKPKNPQMNKPLLSPHKTIDLTEYDVANVSSHMESLLIDVSREEENLHPVPLKRQSTNDVNSQVTTLIIEDSFDEENLPSFPFKKESQNDVKITHLEDSGEKDILLPAIFTKEFPNLNRSCLSNGHFAEVDTASKLSAAGNSFTNTGSKPTESFTIKTTEQEQSWMEDASMNFKEEMHLSLSKAQLPCDFNLVLEDSLDREGHLVSMGEMESIMETSEALEKEAILVLDETEENMSQEGNKLETSMEHEIKNESNNIKHPVLRLEDSSSEIVERSHNEMDVLKTMQKTNCFEVNASMDDDEEEGEEIFFSTKRKVTRRIYSESETEISLNEGNMGFSPFSSPSVKAVSASTPKLEKSISDKLFLQTSSSGRRRSIASRKSLVYVAVEEATDVQENIDEDKSEDEEEEYITEVKEVEEVEIDYTEAEPAGENHSPTSGEDSKPNDHLDKSSYTEDSTNDSTDEVELLSDEQVDYLAKETKTTQINVSCREDSYFKLVKRGKELKDDGRVKEALDCFLKALDIKSGDPEVMMITLSLYRQLS